MENYLIDLINYEKDQSGMTAKKLLMRTWEKHYTCGSYIKEIWLLNYYWSLFTSYSFRFILCKFNSEYSDI